MDEGSIVQTSTSFEERGSGDESNHMLLLLQLLYMIPNTAATGSQIWEKMKESLVRAVDGV